MKTLALVTMISFPPTAVATIFQMPFFNWDREGSAPIVNKRFWIYCVMVALLTVAMLAVWWIWSRRQEKFKTKGHSHKSKFTDWKINQTI
jgi:Mg2+ and Co2+ transporter CorA